MLRTLWVSMPCLLISFLSHAAETPRQLAARHQCFGCHAIDEVRAGPGFQDVAERYATRTDAVVYLLKEVKEGSVGKWGTTPMPPEVLPDSDLKQIIEWIMQQ